MQRSLVVYYGISHPSLVFSWYIHSDKGSGVLEENTSVTWDISWYTTRERCITILYHAIENTLVNTINAKDMWRTMERSIPLNVTAFLYFDWLYFPRHGKKKFYSRSSILLFSGLMSLLPTEITPI